MKFLATGMVSPVGLSAPASCAAIRARISPFGLVPFCDRSFGGVVGAMVQGLKEKGPARLAAMLADAVRECLDGRERLGKPVPAPPLLVAVGEAGRIDRPEDLPAQLLDDISARLGVKFAAGSRVVPAGVTGFFELLRDAQRLLDGPARDGCIVAAVDSLMNQQLLWDLDGKQRLKTEINSDGVIPGEAAAAVWVGPAADPRPALAEVLGLGFGDEPSARDRGKPNLGTGLADALRRACRAAGMAIHETGFRVGGMTGERAGFAEATVAVARVKRVRTVDWDLWCPAEKVGDAGAALAACMAVVTTFGFVKKYAPGRSALLSIAAPEGPARAACILAAPREDDRGT